MSDSIVEYLPGISYGASAGMVAVSINPTNNASVKMTMEWKGAKMLLASYDPTSGFFNFAPGSPVICPADAKIIVEGTGTGAIAWRSL